MTYLRIGMEDIGRFCNEALNACRELYINTVRIVFDLIIKLLNPLGGDKY